MASCAFICLFVVIATIMLRVDGVTVHDTSMDSPKFHFSSVGEFRIIVFKDLHLGDGARPFGSDKKTVGVMNSVLDHEPGTGLVVLNWNITSCGWLATDSVNGFLDKAIKPRVGRNIPFATTFGNHDMSKTCSPRLTFGTHPGCSIWWDCKRTWSMVAVAGDPGIVGTNNYYIPGYGKAASDSEDMKTIIWLFVSKVEWFLNLGKQQTIR